jgi:hypothetical protein
VRERERERGTQDTAGNTRKTINPPQSKLWKNHQKLAFYQQWLEWAYGWGDQTSGSEIRRKRQSSPPPHIHGKKQDKPKKIKKKQDPSRTNLKLVQKTMTQPHDPSREMCCWKNRNG